MAAMIVQNNRVSEWDRVFAGAYITGEFLGHATILVYGGILVCGYASSVCFTALTAGPGVLESLCRYGDCIDKLNNATEQWDELFSKESTRKDVLELTGNGPAYEKWVIENIGGEGEYYVDGTQFDNKLGNVLMEAKSVSFENWEEDPTKFQTFRDQIGRENAIAHQYGYGFLLRMINQPPEYVIEWLEKKGIDYIIDSAP